MTTAKVSRSLLSEPYLLWPGDTSVTVAWVTEFAGHRHAAIVGERAGQLDPAELRAAAHGAPVNGVTAVPATSHPLSHTAEDADSQLPHPPATITRRHLWRQLTQVTGLTPGRRTPYRVVSVDGDRLAVSKVYTLAPTPPAGSPLRILLTSDHQLMPNTPANLQRMVATVGRVDAVFHAGDLVNVPDRASEWFDDLRGTAFFPSMQGRAARQLHGVTYTGGEILQHAPLFPVIGNHEVQGRPAATLRESFEAAVPHTVATPGFHTTTYQELFHVPGRYYAVSFGDIRLVALCVTRIWRSPDVPKRPARWRRGRFTEAPASLADPLAQGWGSHIVEPISAGSPQYEWLRAELAGPAFRAARYRVVMLHEGPHGLGSHIEPPFTDPVRIEEPGRVRYEYPRPANQLLRDLAPLLEQAGADLVLNGHSHLWNRFVAGSGTHYLETSNVGNSYGAFHPASGRSRPAPPPPWRAEDYQPQGDPGGLTPVIPTVAPLINEHGVPQPFVASNDHTVFSILDTGAGEVVSYRYDLRTPRVAPQVLDRFPLGRPGGDEPSGGAEQG